MKTIFYAVPEIFYLTIYIWWLRLENKYLLWRIRRGKSRIQKELRGKAKA